MTRSNPQGEIGFLSDIRRMNVGMTRARCKLLLVVDSSKLCHHPFFWRRIKVEKQCKNNLQLDSKKMIKLQKKPISQ